MMVKKLFIIKNKSGQVLDISQTKITAQKHLKDFKRFGIKSAKIIEKKSRR